MENDIHIISFSGGKDSTALILWAKEYLEDYQVVFCDTNWEHPITYEYIRYINDKLLDGKLITIRSDKYAGFEDMCIQKHIFPRSFMRFCTDNLKLVPMKKYIQQYKDDEVYMYVGVRADESYSRSKLPEQAWDDYYKCTMMRPLIRWTAEQCFDLMRRHDIEPNPLYKMGMKRVGCMPCILAGKSELKEIMTRFPDIVDRIKKLEADVIANAETLDKTFFPKGYIPEYAYETLPTAEKVFEYITRNTDQLALFDEEPTKCMSHYAICE